MVTWGPGVFQSDEALDFADGLAEDLYGVIEEFFNEDVLDIFEYGESAIIPRLLVFTYLARLGHLAEDPSGSGRCSPPRLELIRSWRSRYLEAFDSGVESFEGDEKYRRDRRIIIENVFDDLEELVSGMVESHKLAQDAQIEETIGWTLREPDNCDAYFRLGELQLEKGDWSASKDSYLKSIELGLEEWGQAVAHDALARCFMHLGDLEEAMAHANIALEMDSCVPRYLTTRGEIFLRKGKLTEALCELNKALDEQENLQDMCMDSSFALAHATRSLVRYGLGDLEGSAEDKLKARQLGYLEESNL